jgi:hypothetical protein
MPLREFTGGGWKNKIRLPKPPKPKTGRKSKKSSKGSKGKKAKKTTTAKTHAVASFHEQAGAGSIGNAGTGGSLPFAGVGSTAGASPRAVMELSGVNTVTAEGLGGAILDLVSEGKLTVAHALAAWTHEQNRLANRAWRRPGGLQRMGGL